MDQDLSIAPRVVGAYVQPLLDVCASLGLDRTRLAQEAGLPDDYLCRPLDELPSATYVALLEAASRLSRDPMVGLRVGEFFRVGTFSLLGLSLMSCPTLGVALQQVLKYETLVHDLGTSEFVLDEGVGRFTWFPRHDSAVLVDTVFAGMLHVTEWLCARQVPLLGVTLKHQPRKQARYQDCFHAPVQGGAQANTLSFSADLLHWRLPHADPALLPVLDQWAARMLAARHGRQGLVMRVREILRRALPQVLNLEQVARQLDMSGRTLQRRLKDAGGHLHRELETVRKEIAEDYLRHGDWPLTEIAYMLGYQEASSFSHAFRQWHGCSPAHYRKTRHGGG